MRASTPAFAGLAVPLAVSCVDRTAAAAEGGRGIPVVRIHLVVVDHRLEDAQLRDVTLYGSEILCGTPGGPWFTSTKGLLG